jgi:hypothetical protein
MKMRTLIACAVSAAALPLAPAWASASATTLGGPQGTGAYGTVDLLDLDRDGVINAENAEERAAPAIAYDRNGDGVISPSEYAAVNDARDTARGERRNTYSGPSWATNPPAPAM